LSSQYQMRKNGVINVLKATASMEQIMLAITYLKGLLRDAKRRGDRELVEYVGEIIGIYEARLQPKNNNN